MPRVGNSFDQAKRQLGHEVPMGQLRGCKVEMLDTLSVGRAADPKWTSFYLAGCMLAHTCVRSRRCSGGAPGQTRPASGAGTLARARRALIKNGFLSPLEKIVSRAPFCCPGE